MHVRAIALALGVHTGNVHKVLGDTFEVPCCDCGTIVRRKPSSRTAIAELNRNGRGWSGWKYTRCETCQAVEDARARESAATWRRADEARAAAREAERRRLLAELRAGGYWLDDDGTVILPDTELACYEHTGHGCDGTLVRVEDAEAWRTGRGMVFRRDGRARHEHRPTLAVYIKRVTPHA